MSAAHLVAVKSVHEEVKRVSHKVNDLFIEDKAGWIFFVSGLLLLSFGIISVGLVYQFVTNMLIIFLCGSVSMILMTSGYSLIHKSLRGAWL